MLIKKTGARDLSCRLYSIEEERETKRERWMMRAQQAEVKKKRKKSHASAKVKVSVRTKSRSKTHLSQRRLPLLVWVGGSGRPPPTRVKVRGQTTPHSGSKSKVTLF